MKVRTYGTSGPLTVVLHGGPGAPGYMAPVARQLARDFRVLEPFQRGSGEEPLTVATHVEDLHDLITGPAAGERPALVGSSWGAMLALAYAAEYPGRCSALVLIGCGTFDKVARARMKELISERMDDKLQAKLDAIAGEFPDPDARLSAEAKSILPIYAWDPITTDLDGESCDARANRETWDDMLRLQEEGAYPAAFAAIEEPVLMLHGTFDPHPGRMIETSLRSHVPQLEYREWDQCGHYPWIERAVHEEFYSVTRRWLLEPGL